MEIIKISPEAAFILGMEIKRVQKELDSLKLISEKGEYAKTDKKSEIAMCTDRIISAAKKLTEAEKY